MSRWPLVMLVGGCLCPAGCFERIVEPADVFGDIKQGETYSPASTMIDDWYAVEAIDPQTFAINEPNLLRTTHRISSLATRGHSCSMRAAANGLPDRDPCGKWQSTTQTRNRLR